MKCSRRKRTKGEGRRPEVGNPGNPPVVLIVSPTRGEKRREVIMMKQLVLGVGLATALACTAPAAFAQNTTGQKFLKEAMEGSLAEIQMGKLAQEKGNSPGVRDFGKTLVDDHTKAEQKAQDAARSAGLQPVGEPNKKQRDMYQKMSQKSGAAFDRAFIKDMVSDHKK